MATEYQKKIEEELELIKKVLQKFPKGASAEEIIESSDLDIGLRTLQRRLKTLIEQIPDKSIRI